MIPTEIQNIITEYQREFERVDREIETCVNKYYDIEDKVMSLKARIVDTDLCSYHAETVTHSLSETVIEAGRIIDRILVEETVHF